MPIAVKSECRQIIHVGDALSTKEVFRFFEEALHAGIDLFVAKGGKFLELGFLRGIKVSRHLDRHSNVQIA